MRGMRGFAHESEEVFAFGLDEMEVEIRVLPYESQACALATASAHLTENKSRCRLTTPSIHYGCKLLIDGWGLLIARARVA